MDEKVIEQIAVTSVIACLGYIYSQINAFYLIATVVTFMDFFSGITAAWVRSEFDSRYGMQGMLRSLGILTLPFFAILVDYTAIILGNVVNLAISTNGLLYVLTCSWIVGINGCSFLANLKRMGIPIPQFLVLRMAELHRKELKGLELKKGVEDNVLE